MAVAREKHRAHRRKKMDAVKAKADAYAVHQLVQPMEEQSISDSPVREKQKIKVKAKSALKSALVQGDGRSMTMDVD